jgi:putative hydrolase of the HAD superfamily
MTDNGCEIIRRHSRPLEPLETSEPSRLALLAPVDAVLFDIYGTLLISGSGDIGGGDQAARVKAIAAALQAVGLPLQAPPDAALAVWHAEIERQHQQARQAGIDFPEVDILDVWRGALAVWMAQGWIPATDVDVAVLAVEFEVRANPVWPMPGMLPTLKALRDAGKTLGVISNAQFFTLGTFPALVGQTPDQLGFEPDLQFYSYRYGQAKPGRMLYELAVAALRRRGIPPGHVLYVGNDMRNDVAPAARCGFRTAWFAGDARSLRRRQGDPHCAGFAADVTVTQLSDVIYCVNS